MSGGTANLAGLVNVSGSNTFSSGTANLTGNTICINNTVTISGGIANFSGTGLVSSAVVSLSSGGLGGTSVVTINNVMNWTGGIMTGSGRTIIPAGATLNVSNPGTASMTAGTNIPTGDQCWTLFLNTRNFKGPVAFFTPYFWSRAAVEDPRLSGLLLDNRPTNPNRALQMET